ncbi:MAG: 16S rRNA (cytosine(967)-C(5))-methyltransferase RsmB [Gammaproteobacteria bacterium]|nr:16S rRNA (cytosine(967)-C(5))-methyltransferase RsmB [Gammaproteobacteria bacterium]
MPGKNNNNETSLASRKAALNILLSVLRDDGKSLSSLTHLTENIDARDAAFARMLSFGVLRFYQQLQALLKPFIKKPLKAKDIDVQLVMLMAVYQIMYSRVPEFAVVDSAVQQIRKSKKKWAASMVNAVLRSFLRQIENKDLQEVIGGLESEEAIYSHPQWIINRMQEDWPDSWREILQANNQQAPMTLRINLQQTTVDDFIAELEKDFEISAEKISGIPTAIKLEQARDVKQLPGYNKGWFSVQDAGAQLAAQILQPKAGDYILDACAAPGGKTAHMFEMQADITLTALDISQSRLQRVEENCQRLGFKPKLITADVTEVEKWWDGKQFDKILLDVPCSAVGVIRRHPDIKHLRWDEDIETLVQLQRDILLKNWQLLKPGGFLLYATCSLFKAENEQQVTWFLQQNEDASLVDLTNVVSLAAGQESAAPGLQLFPVSGDNDGFYYALLQKA